MRVTQVHGTLALCLLSVIKIQVIALVESIETSLSLGNDVNSILDLQSNIPEDEILNFTELVTNHGFQCEEHDVITKDGYILTIFNVKGDTSRPVLLMHGIISNADTFICRGNTSLVVALAMKGYDVWAGNFRGNKYAQRHITLDPVADNRAFWNYSQHEIGVYDVPAIIDYVLNQTDQSQLQAIGHSQGNTIFYILTSEKPEYNDKIKLFIALAPISYLHHIKGLLPLLKPAWPALKDALQLSGTVHLLSRNAPLIQLVKAICTQKVIGYPICSSVAFSVVGDDPEEFEPAFLPTLVRHFPDAVSTKNIDHFVQIITKKRFCKYDYGTWKNLRLYGDLNAPDYSLSNVRMPVALLYGKNDYLAALEDVKLLREQLPNVVFDHVMERDLFNHLDFVYGKRMDEYLFPVIFDLLEQYVNTK